jgi:hypothetical protein
MAALVNSENVQGLAIVPWARNPKVLTEEGLSCLEDGSASITSSEHYSDDTVRPKLK